MFFKEKIYLCTNCKTGQKTYGLDSHSEFCPYISCYEENNCPFFKPLNPMECDVQKKKNFFHKVLNVFKR